jgi:hypothetical protein
VVVGCWVVVVGVVVVGVVADVEPDEEPELDEEVAPPAPVAAPDAPVVEVVEGALVDVAVVPEPAAEAVAVDPVAEDAPGTARLT